MAILSMSKKYFIKIHFKDKYDKEEPTLKTNHDNKMDELPER